MRVRSLTQYLRVAVVLAASLEAGASEPPHVTGPVSPRDSLKHLVVSPGLRVELVAHEPDILDPVAIRFDEDGRMWVVEMRDYPTAQTKGVIARSRISVLSDDDGDGFFERSQVFADDLPYATGVQPWKGGVFVTISGEVAYLKDTSGDGRADLKDTWYTGFAQDNTQLRANHPTLALDNYIYVANGLRGGVIVDAHRPDEAPVPISGMDFRFDPHTRKFEAVSGVGQFGLTFDDYGNRFVCSNRNPAMHIVLEDRHLKKNPLIAVSAVATDVAKWGADSRVFPITTAWTTSHLHAGQFTAACGLHIYRGDALPEEYDGNLFVCEPTGHLVQRQIVRPLGVTFCSTVANERVEFLASRDPWWSPVNLETGPDGGLYIVDMYRAVIEHPHWMPEELRRRPDLMDGNDRGRIYRIVPQYFSRPEGPCLSHASSQSLVELLAHPNSWWRETAARLLLERQDQNVGPQLEGIALNHKSALARIHAIRLLQGLDLLTEPLLLDVFDDPQPRVLEQTIVAAEGFVADSDELSTKAYRLVTHSDARVRFQALLVNRPLPPLPAFAPDRWELEAMLIAAGERGGVVLAEMLRESPALEANVHEPKRFVADLARLAGASVDERQWISAAIALLKRPEYLRVGLAGLLADPSRSGLNINLLRLKLDDASTATLDRALSDARTDAANAALSEATRSESIDLLAVAGNAMEMLVPLAIDEPNQAIRLRAVAAISRSTNSVRWQLLLDSFSRQTPAVQAAILEGSLASPARSLLLLDAVAAGRIKATEVGVNHARQLMNHSDPAIKRQAEQLLADAIPADREQALAEYQVVLEMKSDAARGRGLFDKHCGTCHQVGGVGVPIAPDISDSREKSVAQLLTDIIQPNRAIDSNYFSYTAVTVGGRVHTGILAAETSTSVTLKQAEGKDVTLRSDEIEELQSDGISFMPDGLEKNISPQDMADLIGFVKHWRYLEDPQQFITLEVPAGQ
jgi:putative membrane-bound dehydrogenase-like protein